MNDMGHDSKLTYDEVGEQLLIEHLADSDEPDPRDELIEDMRRVLKEAMVFWRVNSSLSERYFDKWQQGQGRIAELEAKLTSLAEWCLKQVSVIDAGLLIDPNDDFWRGNKTAYQLVAIEICAMLDGES
jgi:hypothetical protein